MTITSEGFFGVRAPMVMLCDVVAFNKWFDGCAAVCMLIRLDADEIVGSEAV